MILRPRVSSLLVLSLQLFVPAVASSKWENSLSKLDSSKLDPIWTTSGLVQGYTDNTTVPDKLLHKWLGVRFAQDTSGENRWRPPQPVEANLQDVFDARAYGPACLQGLANGGNGTEVLSEDCLRINVIAPVGARGLPVYIYSHGGGFNSGASSDPKIDGSFLAAKGIVFVSYNYRLALFGYPHSSELARARETQNLGLLDTRAAALWTLQNIERFGGDPLKIVIGGESVGAEMTNQYLSAFPGDSFVRGAIMQSADTAQPVWPVDQQLEVVAQRVGCLAQPNAGTSMLGCLRTKSSVELKQAVIDTGAQFQPVVDNITIFKDYVKQIREERTARVPMLIGTNRDEGTLIVEGELTAYLDDISAYIKSNNLNFPHSNETALDSLYPVPSSEYPTAYNASAAIWRDAHMLCLVHNIAATRSKINFPPVWRYRWDLVGSNLNSRGARIGAFHGSDIRFVMGTWRTIELSPPFVPANETQIEISNLMVEAWTNFIKNPSLGPQIPGWRRRFLVAEIGVVNERLVKDDGKPITVDSEYPEYIA